ncbi:membrane protein of ER body-like protein [Bidens hawaiensis]|uniref:membrane protein of ER body-like protein n=1 Tax=Bidens hawaiensis TaxID=980011 RepID=UPI00404955E9
MIFGVYNAKIIVVSRGRPWLGYEGVLAEILKSIVYGGLLEVIASLSVVASAVASDAATLSIISLALASLIGGVFVIGHNLWDLRDDCYKDDSSQGSNKEATSKYRELLGQVNYFPLHTFFAILSYLVFGMVPPIAYGLSFHETNDKDLTLLVVAIMSLLCVSVLAIFKAYINKCTIFEYFKIVVYYITTTISVAGLSYVAGNLITRLMEEYGLFETSSSGAMSLLSHATSPSLASF